MQFRDKPKKRVIINITSLIDVLFLLLIFFLVSSTFLEQPGMKLDLPEATQTEAVRAESATLYIARDNTLLLDDEPVNKSALPERLKAIAPNLGDKGLILKADEKVEYGLVVEVMDMIKRAGIVKLVVATRLKPDQGS